MVGISGSDGLLVLWIHFCVINAVVSGNVSYTYHSQPLPWYQAQITCNDQCGQLSIARSGQLEEFSNHTTDVRGLWAGGRVYRDTWQWSDSAPLYDYAGCFQGEINQTVSVVQPNGLLAEDVFHCFTLCHSPAVGLQMSSCLCLHVVPMSTLEVDENLCTTNCAASLDEKCGGQDVYSVYKREMLPYDWKYDPSNMSFSIQDDQCAYLYYPPTSNRFDNGTFHLMVDLCTEHSVKRRKSFCQTCISLIIHPLCSILTEEDYHTWDLASQRCRAHSMILANQESGDLRPYFQLDELTEESYWLGLRRETTLSWMDGNTLIPSLYPALQTVDGECISVVMLPTGSLILQLEDCARPKPFICEYEEDEGNTGPPPTAAQPHMSSSQPTSATHTTTTTALFSATATPSGVTSINSIATAAPTTQLMIVPITRTTSTMTTTTVTTTPLSTAMMTPSITKPRISSTPTPTTTPITTTPITTSWITTMPTETITTATTTATTTTTSTPITPTTLSTTTISLTTSATTSETKTVPPTTTTPAVVSPSFTTTPMTTPSTTATAALTTEVTTTSLTTNTSPSTLDTTHATHTTSHSQPVATSTTASSQPVQTTAAMTSTVSPVGIIPGISPSATQPTVDMTSTDFTSSPNSSATTPCNQTCQQAEKDKNGDKDGIDNHLIPIIIGAVAAGVLLLVTVAIGIAYLWRKRRRSFFKMPSFCT